jgi:hypothetical protein
MRFYLNNGRILHLEKLLQLEEAFFMRNFVGLKTKKLKKIQIKKENKKYTTDY